MKTVFWGTPASAAGCLEYLLQQGVKVVGVVTQPDKPVGRSQVLTAPAVKRVAQAANIPCLQPLRVREPAVLAALQAWQPACCVLVAYGKIIPPMLLPVPRHFINLHFSLLPRYRGAAPVQRALMDGLDRTGVTVQHLAEKLDAGDIILQETVPIEPDDTTDTLLARCVATGAPLLVRAMASLERGVAPRIAQDDTAATLAPRLTQEDGYILWNNTAAAIVNRIRACNPWPGATTWIGGATVKIWHARVGAPPSTAAAPGTILSHTRQLLVAAGDGVVDIIELQPAGKKRMTAAAFLAGHRERVTRFDPHAPAGCQSSPAV